jgi:hypothetical protein
MCGSTFAQAFPRRGKSRILFIIEQTEIGLFFERRRESFMVASSIALVLCLLPGVFAVAAAFYAPRLLQAENAFVASVLSALRQKRDRLAAEIALEQTPNTLLPLPKKQRPPAA